MKTVPCKGCHKPIVFAALSDGKMIPLDPRPPIYAALLWEDDQETPKTVERHFTAYVSHFATCPNASEFSAGRKKP